MQGKMSDSTMKYFIAISENKKKELELKSTEFKINVEQKKMLTRYWKDKIDVFDDMIRLNVRTPTYTGRASPGPEDECNDNGRIILGPMKVDAKLMSNKPISLQRGKKGASAGIEPVISIEGSDAICYPNKEARKGRKVALNPGVIRRLEQCKQLAESIDSIHDKERDYENPSPYHRRAGSRPFTAPRGNIRSRLSQKRNAKSAGVRPAATVLVGQSEGNDCKNQTEDSSAIDRRTPTSGNRLSPASPMGLASLTMATAKRLTSASTVSSNKRLLSTSSSSTDKRILSTSSVS